MRTILLALLSALWLTGPAYGHADDAQPPRPFDPALAEQTAFGIAADPAKATRTVAIAMGDDMRFTPQALAFRKGETVRFVVLNKGKLLHELVLGTREDLDKHAEAMKKFPGMEHDEPHMVHVKPGTSGSLTWTFNRAGEFHFACLIPEHYGAGMMGRIVVK